MLAPPKNVFLVKDIIMKRVSFLFVFAVSIGWGQLEDSELAALKLSWNAELNQQIIDLGIGTTHQDGWSDISDSIYNAYEKDTFLINGILTRQLEVDGSTFGMVRALSDYEASYDKLLNKYYLFLLGRMEKVDRETLKESQRNWIKFRDSERKFSGLLTEDKYSGGGTIQQIFYADWYADFTKRRVEELIDYLGRL